MAESKKICFIGIDCVDICLYTSRVFNAFSKKVALVDNSSNQLIGDSIPGCEMDIDIVDYRNVDFMSMKTFGSFEQDYDVIIYYYGMDFIPEILNRCDDIYLVVNQMKATIGSVNRNVNSLSKPFHFVIKDYIDSKISDAVLKQHFGFDESLIIDTNLLPYDETDYSYSLLAQYNNIYKFDKLSPDFKEFLKAIVVNLYGEDFDDKKFVAKFKKAEKGA